MAFHIGRASTSLKRCLYSLPVIQFTTQTHKKLCWHKKEKERGEGSVNCGMKSRCSQKCDKEWFPVSPSLFFCATTVLSFIFTPSPQLITLLPVVATTRLLISLTTVWFKCVRKISWDFPVTVACLFIQITMKPPQGWWYTIQTCIVYHRFSLACKLINCSHLHKIQMLKHFKLHWPP